MCRDQVLASHAFFGTIGDNQNDTATAAAIRHEGGVQMALPDNLIILIDRRPLIAHCMLTSFKATDRSSTFEMFASVDQWKRASPINAASLVVLCSPGSQSADSERDEVQLAIADIRTWNQTVPVVVMSDCENCEQIIKVVNLGVRGYIPTSISLPVAVQAFRLVLSGGMFIPAECMLSAVAEAATKRASAKQDDEMFSPRQLSVARALRKGTPNKIIAYELNMCESTVKVHVRNIMKKLHAKNRTEVAYLTNRYFSSEH